MQHKMTLDIPELQEGEDDATERQRQFIRELMREAGASGLPDEAIQQLGKWQASAVIEQLKDFKRDVVGTRRGGGSGRKRPAITMPALIGIILIIAWVVYSM